MTTPKSNDVCVCGHRFNKHSACQICWAVIKNQYGCSVFCSCNNFRKRKKRMRK